MTYSSIQQNRRKRSNDWNNNDQNLAQIFANAVQDTIIITNDRFDDYRWNEQNKL